MEHITANDHSNRNSIFMIHQAILFPIYMHCSNELNMLFNSFVTNIRQSTNDNARSPQNISNQTFALLHS